MIQIKNLSFSYTAEPIYQDVTLTIKPKQKVGLVGRNGAGKSTLFKLITQDIEPDIGKIEIQGQVGYVPQEVKHDPQLANAPTIRQYIDPKSQTPDHELFILLAGLEYYLTDLEAKPHNLSGGQKTKLALARALILQPDILLLDEPTNFMDYAGTHFVIDFLHNYQNTLITVSHDLKLLDQSLTNIIEANPHTHGLDQYKGTYSDYLRMKKQRQELITRQHQAQSQQIKRMKKGLEKIQGAQSEKGVRARINLQNRIARAQAALPQLPPQVKQFKLELPEPPRVGDLPIQVKNISKTYGKKHVLRQLDLAIRRNETFLLVGPNGSGKSTLIKILMGLETPDTGTITPGYNLSVGYYSQEFLTLDLDQTVIDAVQTIGKVHESQARSFLGRFMFDTTKIYQTISTLSGGEKTRLAIALLILQPHNLLILDEPTTYLDPLSQRIILEALKSYKGTMLLVSHVSQFVQELKPDRALIMPDQQLVLYDDQLLPQIEKI